MRKTNQDSSDNVAGESMQAPKRAPRRRAVIKTDRMPEEWSPSAGMSAENKSAEEENGTISFSGISESEPVFDPFADVVNAAKAQVEPMPAATSVDEPAQKEMSVAESVADAPEQNTQAQNITGHDGARFEKTGKAAKRQYRQFNNQISPENMENMTPQEQRAAKWGRYPYNRRLRNKLQSADVQSAAHVQSPDGVDTVIEERPEPLPPLPTILLKDLEALSPEDLNKKLEEVLTPEEIAGKWRKRELINSFVRAYMNRNGIVYTSGIIEVTSEGHGFLRSEKTSYQSSPEDIYVAQQFVRRFNLRTGDFLEGPIRDPRLRQDKGKEKFLALGRIDTVNGCTPAEWRRVVPFENLTPIFPNRRIYLETKSDELSTRIMNLFAPIGFGQRGIIVAPPRVGKTVLMQKLANAITENHPDAYLIVLLIDERPEEVTDMQRNTKAHVISSTFDETPERHAQVAEMVIEMSKRMVESGKDVIILLDSITRLARAYNTLQPNSGRILSGGIDAMGLHKPKRFFGAARNIENGGSLTIIATALIDTGSRMDEVIFEEFKGTGNMELVLDRMLSDRRIYPAINIEASGTRKEDLIMHPDELARVWSVRKALSGIQPTEMMDTVIKAMKKTQNNAEFLMNIAMKN